MSENGASNVQVHKGKNDDRFEVLVDGKVAGFTEYFVDDGKRVFFHTEVDEAYAGQGLAAILVRNALESTRSEGLRVVAICPYVVKFVAKNEAEFGDLVDQPTEAIIRRLRG